MGTNAFFCETSAFPLPIPPPQAGEGATCRCGGDCHRAADGAHRRRSGIRPGRRRKLLSRQDRHHPDRPSRRRLLRSLCPARGGAFRQIHSGPSPGAGAVEARRRRGRRGAVPLWLRPEGRHAARPVRGDDRAHAARPAGDRQVADAGPRLYRVVRQRECRLHDAQGFAGEDRSTSCSASRSRSAAAAGSPRAISIRRSSRPMPG